MMTIVDIVEIVDMIGAGTDFDDSVES